VLSTAHDLVVPMLNDLGDATNTLDAIGSLLIKEPACDFLNSESSS